jgi:hypothetical protein
MEKDNSLYSIKKEETQVSNLVYFRDFVSFQVSTLY